MQACRCPRSDRRYSARWRTDKPIVWRLADERRVHLGRLTERSLNGMVIAIDGELDVPPGLHLAPGDASVARRHGFRDAVVRRTAEDAKTRQRLLFVEILG